MIRKVFPIFLLLCGLSYGQTQNQTCTLVLQPVVSGQPVYCLGTNGNNAPIWAITVNTSGTVTVTSVVDVVENYTSAGNISANMQHLDDFGWQGTFYDDTDTWQFHVALLYLLGDGGLVLNAAGAGSLVPAEARLKHHR
jgi:hypothetical protein